MIDRMSIWQQLSLVFRRIPATIDLKLSTVVMRAHSPVQASENEAVCLRHRRVVPWPCEEFLRADAAVDAALERMPK